MDMVLGIKLIIIFIVGVVFVELWRRRFERKKRENYKCIAKSSGWEYDSISPGLFYEKVKHLIFFSRGRQEKSIRVVLTGKHKGILFNLISYHHGSMTSGIPSEYIVLHIEDTSNVHPNLEFLQKWGGYLLTNVITLEGYDSDPLLKKYVIKTDKPEESREFLNAELLKAFTVTAQIRDLYILEMETKQNDFICHMHLKGDKKIKADTLIQFVNLGCEIYREIVKN